MPRGRFAKNLIGQKFFHLTVIERAENFVHQNGSKFAQWVCKCDCGNIITAKGCDLTRGFKQKCGIDCPSFGVSFGGASFNSIYTGYVKGSRRRNISWNLNKAQFRELTSKECFYCGCPPPQFENRKDVNGKYVYNGIDRVENSIGYEINNCVSCCWTCNRAKHSLSQDEFRIWVRQIHNHWAVL